jgi:ornithine decarboxylase
LHSRELALALARVTPTEAAELRHEIVGILSFLEDSVSNSALGSIFDRSDQSSSLNQMLRDIARAYGVPETSASTNGTSGLNPPAVMTLAGRGQAIGIARDCHVSVIGGLKLSGARPIFLVPPFSAELGVLLPLTPEEVASFLDANPQVCALVLTMPTYHGLMGDIVGITSECRARGALLMVDEAHGPHFHFLRQLGFPLAAEDAGADMVTQSTHKVLAALNQGSLLHFNNTRLLRRYEEFQALGFQSTSFSYPILLSIEEAVHQMTERAEELWRPAVDLACYLRAEAASVPGLDALDERVVDGHRVVGLDPTRVTLDVRGTGLSGYQVAEALLKNGDIVELATPDVVLFLVSPSTTREQVEGTLQTLRTLAYGEAGTGQSFAPPPLPDQILTPRQALMHSDRERVPVYQAVGRVCAETIGCYPPGQAIFVAGELVTEEGVRYLSRAVAAGGHLKRVQDDGFRTLEVLRGQG